MSRDTVYTGKWLRRGVDIDEPADAMMRRTPVLTVTVRPPSPLPAAADLRAAARAFADADAGHLMVAPLGEVLDRLDEGAGPVPVVDSVGEWSAGSATDLLDP